MLLEGTQMALGWLNFKFDWKQGSPTRQNALEWLLNNSLESKIPSEATQKKNSRFSRRASKPNRNLFRTISKKPSDYWQKYYLVSNLRVFMFKNDKTKKNHPLKGADSNPQCQFLLIEVKEEEMPYYKVTCVVSKWIDSLDWGHCH
jgi:hypothetical protein